MIKGVHAMFYSDHAAELRAFFRDKFQLPFSDVGDGWLIFDLPEGDLGVHPTDPRAKGHPSGTHAISFYCDDIESTVADLASRGVEFTGPVKDCGFGLVAFCRAPGGLNVELYEPKYSKGS